MKIQSCESLSSGHCVPCEGGVPRFSKEESQAQLAQLKGWNLLEDASKIFKSWNCKDFAKSINFIDRIAELAELEQHHPDLHLTGYRHVRVELTTHAIGGLSVNDFILAAKIDQLST